MELGLFQKAMLNGSSLVLFRTRKFWSGIRTEMEMDEAQLEVLNLDGLAMINQAAEQITNIIMDNILDEASLNKSICLN